jgi:aryl-alcohol dehydrogenase-like predicted oxidoreductase
MKYRKLGRTDIDVSVICLGTMTWGRQNSQDEAFEQMDYAFEQGVNFFDTAELYAVPPGPETYGKTEGFIGNWFQDRGTRSQVFLASKIAGNGVHWIRGGSDITPETIDTALNNSLKRLHTDYIDLYQLHWPNRGGYQFQQYWDYNPTFDAQKEEDEMIAVLEALQKHIKAGKIRYVGLSNESAWGTMKYLQLAEKLGLPRMVSIQNEYNLLSRTFEPDLHEVAVAEDIGLLAWSPLATGALSGKYLAGARPEGTRWTMLGKNISRDTENAQSAIQGYMAVANKHGLDVTQMALAFVNDRPFVTSNIIGATSMEQLKSNIASIDLELSDAVLKDIQSIYRKYPRPY